MSIKILQILSSSVASEKIETIFVTDFESDNNALILYSIVFNRLKSNCENYFWKKISYFRTLNTMIAKYEKEKLEMKKFYSPLKFLVSPSLYFFVFHTHFLKYQSFSCRFV